MAAIESNNATMNPSLHLLEDEIFGLEMQRSVKISNPKGGRSRKLPRVDRLPWQLAEVEGTLTQNQRSRSD